MQSAETVLGVLRERGSKGWRRPGSCAASYAACPSVIHAIRDSDGSATHATLTIIC